LYLQPKGSNLLFFFVRLRQVVLYLHQEERGFPSLFFIDRILKDPEEREEKEVGSLFVSGRRGLGSREGGGFCRVLHRLTEGASGRRFLDLFLSGGEKRNSS